MIAIMRARQIIDAVAGFYGVEPAFVATSGRSAYLMRVKHVCRYVLRHVLGASLCEIGDFMRCDHSTVVASLQKVEGWVGSDADLYLEVVLALAAAYGPAAQEACP